MAKKYALYDTKIEGEPCVGIFDKAEEVAKFTNNKTNSIYVAVNRDYKLNARYKIVKIII